MELQEILNENKTAETPVPGAEGSAGVTEVIAMTSADEPTVNEVPEEAEGGTAPEENTEDVPSEPRGTASESGEPVEVVSIRFRDGGKAYFFSPGGLRLSIGDTVVAETARGTEYGFVAAGNRTVSTSEIVAPLKSVLRVATEEDTRHYEENMKKREEAFRIFDEKVKEHGIDMKLVDVEYTFDNNKLLFYFTADGRVDFRDLVKDLASVFRTRIELRQIGIRDEAKMIGGLGICGRPLCCHSFLSDFVQVSIKMAKEQNLSLNSSKISGACGRLMCCLRYEHDVYEEELAKTPKMDSVVMTPDGEAIVTEVNPLAGTIRVRFTGLKSDMPPKLFHRDDVERTELTKKDIRQREMAMRSTEKAAEPAAPAAEGSEAAKPSQNRQRQNRQWQNGKERPAAQEGTAQNAARQEEAANGAPAGAPGEGKPRDGQRNHRRRQRQSRGHGGQNRQNNTDKPKES